MNIIKGKFRDIMVVDDSNTNIDEETVNSFGEEWTNFNEFTVKELENLGNEYFDILDNGMYDKNSIIADFGCGSGRFSKFFQNKVKKIYAIDPSNSVLAADRLIGGDVNIDIIKASISNLPFEDNFFDFGMSIGVLHHIPNTQKALNDCVKKVKVGGYFYLYLYYNFENRGFIFNSLWLVSNLFRKIISKMPTPLKNFFCNLLAMFVYLPIVTIVRILIYFGVSKDIWSKIPLSYYYNKTFFIMRNDSRDRFGTPLEQRFSKSKVFEMMTNAGLTNIAFSPNVPFWHAVGIKL